MRVDAREAVDLPLGYALSRHDCDWMRRALAREGHLHGRRLRHERHPSGSEADLCLIDVEGQLCCACPVGLEVPSVSLATTQLMEFVILRQRHAADFIKDQPHELRR